MYNVAFRTHQQEKSHLNFWSDQAQAAALTEGDVTEFSLPVAWDQLADRLSPGEPDGAQTRDGLRLKRSAPSSVSKRSAKSHRSSTSCGHEMTPTLRLPLNDITVMFNPEP